MMSEQSAESVVDGICHGVWFKDSHNERRARELITAAIESERSNDTPCQSCGFSAFRDVGDGEQDVETCVICEQREKLKEITALHARLEASKKWQRHLDGCPHTFPMAHNPDCTCGLSEHQKGK